MGRTVEFVLGLIGGIIGFFSALIAIFIGGIGSVFGMGGASTITNLGWLAMIFSIIGIIGASIVKNKTKVGGWMMVVSAVIGLISISFYYVLPFVLLIISGLMALIKRGD